MIVKRESAVIINVVAWSYDDNVHFGSGKDYVEFELYHKKMI